MSKKFSIFLILFLGIFLSAVFYLKFFYYKPHLSKQPNLNLTQNQKVSGPISFIVFGDSGTASHAQLDLANTMLNYNFDFMIHTGDIAYPSGTKNQLEKNFFDIYKKHLEKAPVYPAPGNHDYMTENLRPYLESFDLPRQALNEKDNERYYSFDVDNIHFVALDTNVPLYEISALRADDMADWLSKDLAKNSDRTWKVVFFHHPPYSSGQIHGDDKLVQEILVPIFEKYSVDLVLSGHEHNYERTCKLLNGICSENGVTYLVSGGGGADLYQFGPQKPFTAGRFSQYHFLRLQVQSCKMQINAIGLSNQILDNFSIDKCN